MALSYCRVSTTAQDLTRQIDAMRAAGVAEGHIYVDKRTGATMDRDGLTALQGLPGPGTGSTCSRWTGSAATCARP